eukprot:TRINITY_DN4154_c0_g1_i2.p1 TRINITY_DN4154_c0_g1~~TRINITY_DN4154_c0_g1_i2.p1  ORF type:complete len:383 (-),score=85.24 TRINITY_DN4154_c0_g1_i2:1009-2157(-)
MIGTKKPPSLSLEEWLKNGVVLCRLVNRISPNSVVSIYEGNQSFGHRENIMNYNKAIKGLGVQSQNMFDTGDLYEGKNFNIVLNHLNVVAIFLEGLPDYVGPTIADTSQAKCLYGDSLKGVIVVDEELEDTFTPEEKVLVEWANKCLPSKVPKIKNLESLRTCVKIFYLVCHFMPCFGEFGGFDLNPKTAVDFLQNAEYIISNLSSLNFQKIPDISMQGLALGDRAIIVKLLTFVRVHYDESVTFLTIYTTIRGGWGDKENNSNSRALSFYSESSTLNPLWKIQERNVTQQPSPPSLPPPVPNSWSVIKCTWSPPTSSPRNTNYHTVPFHTKFLAQSKKERREGKGEFQLLPALRNSAPRTGKKSLVGNASTGGKRNTDLRI